MMNRATRLTIFAATTFAATTFAATLCAAGCGQRKAISTDRLIGTKWAGVVDVTQPCDRGGGYSGTDLKMCMVFIRKEENILIAQIDWDSRQLREDCNYFNFVGALDNKGDAMTMMRRDVEEQDDKLRPSFDGDQLVGTFEVDGTCGQWPVTLSLSDSPPLQFEPAAEEPTDSAANAAPTAPAEEPETEL